MHVRKYILLLYLFLLPSILQSFRFPWSRKKKTIEEDAAIVQEEKIIHKEPDGIAYFRNAYPDVGFTAFYDEEKDDFKLIVQKNGSSDIYIFYWCDGKLLPPDELENSECYTPILYNYENKHKFPEDMTEDEIQELKEYTSRESRKNGSGESQFFLSAIYGCETRASTEKKIKCTKFLGKKLNIHEDIVQKIKIVEEKIQNEAKTDAEIKKFISGLKSCGGYNWRLIDGTKRKSMHSFGIAIDFLPKKIRGEIFWSWARDKNPKGWMKTPLSSRWLPPQKLIDIFEEEGFIWGGYWTIWDNMHFEYRPELIEQMKAQNAKNEETQNEICEETK